MISYAQDKEDIILAEILKGVTNGFYIDVGANSPDVLSVTKMFYEHGWWGINIEPLPNKYNELREKRDRDINLNIGVSNTHSVLTMRVVPEFGSTFSEQVIADQHYENYPTLQVETYTMAEILEKYKPTDIHFCKIDVEGFEKQVLEGWDWNYRPWAFCIESTKPGTDIPCYEEWEYILLDHGYKLKQAHGINRFYIDSTREW